MKKQITIDDMFCKQAEEERNKEHKKEEWTEEDIKAEKADLEYLDYIDSKFEDE